MSNPERIEFNPATIRPLAPEPQTSQKSAEPGRTADGRTFDEVLRGTLPSTTPAERPGLSAVPEAIPGSSIRWSSHASARLRQRGIEFSPEQHARLETAVDKAVAKGAKDSLVLLDDTALVVSAKNRTVITALGMHQAKENVFTNIDSAVIA
jgi:flagellar operon protein